jgi:hypothetical protein
MDTFYKCSSCGEIHEGLPFDYSAKYPDYYFEIPAEEREARIFVTEDICVVDNEFFFIRGCIEVPVNDLDDRFAWGVWCSLSEQSYNQVMELWNEPNVENEPPFFGWLNTNLPSSLYPQTLNLKTKVYLRNNNQRPFIELEPTYHPLAVEQREGITTKRVQAIAEILLHNSR